MAVVKSTPTAFGKVPDSHNYVQFLILKIMKKILLFSFMVIASAAMAANAKDSLSTKSIQSYTGGTGGQSGTINPPPPPPPPVQ